MVTELVHLGFNNMLAMNRVIVILSPEREPTKRLVQSAKDKGLLIDMTHARRSKAVIILDTGHVVTAALTPETIAGRLAASRGADGVKGALSEAEGEE